jgi:type IV secretion system T-DNA border endonuclease VirD2
MSDLPRIDPLSVPALGLVLEGVVRPKRKAPNIKNYGAKLARVTKKAPEVLVKVSGTGRNPGQILAHMTYITRNGKVEAESERGEKIEGLAEVKEVFAEWGFDTSKASTRNRAQTVNIVLSMPEGTDPEAVRNASREFANEQFGENHQYLMALHTDTKQPHVHLSVKAQGFDMTWLKRSKADLQQWRDGFAQKMRDQGIEAEATPRRARGVVRKSATQQMHHLAKTPTRSTVMKAKVDEAIREIDGQQPAGARPWERAIAARQQNVRSTYAQVEEELRAAKDEVTKKAAVHRRHGI